MIFVRRFFKSLHVNRHFHAFTSPSALSQAAAVCIPPLPAHRRGRARWPATAQPRASQPIRLSVHRRRAGASSGIRSKASRHNAAPTAQHRRCRAESREQCVQRTVRAAPFVNATCTTLRVTRCVPALEHGNLSCPRTSPRPRADLALLLPSQLDRCRNRHRLRVHRRHRHHRHHPAAIAQPLSSSPSPSPSRYRHHHLHQETGCLLHHHPLGWRRRGQLLDLHAAAPAAAATSLYTVGGGVPRLRS